ncbi:MAG: DNA mismatch repair endonuclease MutL [Deltaproteobacteria bacterium]|nr:MAG: DNA mismatch repair endonuclease MutL [Deltaproteobacteria bacterium]
MSPKIRILPEQLANQIAAGEVVERPASVVKELLENAIDAGASELLIEIEQGGRQLVRVTDNGCGMAKDDLFLALERHATSKIGSSADLFALHTLGFRGEALPSIASVARLRLTSRTPDQELGWQIYAEGGTVRRAEAVGAPAGTVVEVRDLFFNTPGRRKFLRSEETEFGHLADVVVRLALARPDIHVRLTHNGRTHLEAYRHQRLEERADALLGRSLTADMLTVDAESGSGEMLTGLIGSPRVNRSSSSHLYAYVNGRFVRDRVVQHAILEAYRTLLEKRRYPVAVLFLDLPPEMVDVNVHPTKHEVRFREQQKIHDFVANAVRTRLLGENLAAAAPPPVSVPLGVPVAAPPDPAFAARTGVQEALAAYGSRKDAVVPPAVRPGGKGEALVFPEPASAPTVPRLPDGWRVIGQYLNSYLVCQAGEDLLLVDQHAAHERIGFEKLRRQLQAAGIERQRLLFPLVIECDHRQAAVVAERLDDFARLGFELEAFGGRSFSLLAIPQLLAGADAGQLVLDMAEELAQIGRGTTLDAAVDQVLMRLACHAMIRAHQPLARPEMEALLGELAAIDFGSHCPHGRPVIRRLGRSEIERFFHRG